MDLASDQTSLRGLVGLLVLFVCLSAGYNVVQPIFEPPDEIAHFRYAQWLAEEKRLPEIYADAESARHEVGQPPLYYLLIAPIIGAFDTSDWLAVAPANPHYRTQANSVNVYVHGNSAETFPYAKTARSVHLARAINTIAGSLTIIGCFGLARLIIPERALLAAALVALNPQFISASSTLTNDAIVSAFCALGLWLLIALMRREKLSLFIALVIGLLWGAASLTKMSGLTFGGVVMLGLSLAALHSGRWGQFFTRGFALTGSAAAFAGWWFWRNWQLYEDPLAWDALLFANRTLVREEAIGAFGALTRMRQVFFTYWASFGNRLPLPSLFDYFAIVLTGLAVFGLIVTAIKSKSSDDRRDGRVIEIVVMLVWIGGSFVSFLRWMLLVEETAQGRLLLPTVTAVAVLLTLGLARIDSRGWLHRGLIVGLGIWAVVLPLLVVRPAYALPGAVSAESIPFRINQRYGDQIQLHGYNLVTPSLLEGESLTIDLYWEALQKIEDSFVISLHAVDAAGEVVASYDGVPVRALYPTQHWRVGHLFRDRYTLSRLPEQATSGVANLYVNVRPISGENAGVPLPIYVDDVQIVDAWRLAPFKISMPDQDVAAINPIEFTFGDLGTLVGYCLSSVPISGEPVDVRLVWEAAGSTEADYTVFVHLLDESGQRLLGQGDSPPVNNRYPTSIWEEGETIVDIHQITWIDQGTPLRFNLGLYDPVSGKRLPIVGSDGQRIEDNSLALPLPTGHPMETIHLCR